MSLTYAHPNWWGYHWATWGSLILAGLVAVVMALQSRWQETLLLGGFMLAALVYLLALKETPALVDLAVVTALFINTAAYVWDLYPRWWWVDKIIHGYTFFAITLLLASLMPGTLVAAMCRDHPWLFILTLASFGLALGVLWEIWEWLYDLMAPTNVIKGKTDTLLDLIVDSVGALGAAWLSWRVLLGWITSKDGLSA